MIAAPLQDIIMPQTDSEDMTPAKPEMDETADIAVRFRSARRCQKKSLTACSVFRYDEYESSTRQEKRKFQIKKARGMLEKRIKGIFA